MTGDPEHTEERTAEDHELDVTKDTIKDLDPLDADEIKGGKAPGFSQTPEKCPP
jgi:hypothetical protein